VKDGWTLHQPPDVIKPRWDLGRESLRLSAALPNRCPWKLCNVPNRLSSRPEIFFQAAETASFLMVAQELL
jgi:hypothetical protein